MAQFAFLFYAGDYLRDTQCLSEKAQVAYDRIMCEHMRNICITQQQLNFFTKRLTDEEKSELLMVLVSENGGYKINWVVDSILKRQAYSESRRSNRIKKEDKDILTHENISKTYVPHMVIEIEKEKEVDNKEEIKTAQPKKNNDVAIRAMVLDLTPQLDNPDFFQAWAGWWEGRAKKKHPQTHLAAKLALKKLNQCKDLQHAIKTLEYSTLGGYPGLYPESQNKNQAQTEKKFTTSTEEEYLMTPAEFEKIRQA